MPLPTITNVHRCAISGTLPGGRAWANIVHAQWTGAGTPTIAQRQALMNALYATYSTDQAGTNSRISYFWPTLTKLTQIRETPLDGSTASLVSAFTLAGAATGDPLPNGVALVVTLRTAKRGRSYRGRLYLPGFHEGNNDAPGVPSGNLVAAAYGNWDATRTALASLNWQLVVASYLHSTAEPVTQVTADSKWDEQRRRQRA